MKMETTPNFKINQIRKGCFVEMEVIADTKESLSQAIDYLFAQYLPAGYATEVVEYSDTHAMVKRYSSCD